MAPWTRMILVKTAAPRDLFVVRALRRTRQVDLDVDGASRAPSRQTGAAPGARTVSSIPLTALNSGARRSRAASPPWHAVATAARSGLAKTNPFIEAAHPIPLRINQDVLVAERAEFHDDVVAHVGFEGARQLVAADFQPRNGVVMPYTADAKAEATENALGAFDHAQLHRGDFGMVGDPRRQAGGRRLIPGGQTGVPRQVSDVDLGQACFVERTAHAEFARRLAPWPVVTAIVRVAAIDDHGESARDS